MINLLLSKKWGKKLVNQPAENGGWTSREIGCCKNKEKVGDVLWTKYTDQTAS